MNFEQIYDKNLNIELSEDITKGLFSLSNFGDLFKQELDKLYKGKLSESKFGLRYASQLSVINNEMEKWINSANKILNLNKDVYIEKTSKFEIDNSSLGLEEVIDDINFIKTPFIREIMKNLSKMDALELDEKTIIAKQANTYIEKLSAFNMLITKSNNRIKEDKNKVKILQLILNGELKVFNKRFDITN
jgi:hypothetical protein